MSAGGSGGGGDGGGGGGGSPEQTALQKMMMAMLTNDDDDDDDEDEDEDEEEEGYEVDGAHNNDKGERPASQAIPAALKTPNPAAPPIVLAVEEEDEEELEVEEAEISIEAAFERGIIDATQYQVLSRQGRLTVNPKAPPSSTQAQASDYRRGLASLGKAHLRR